MQNADKPLLGKRIMVTRAAGDNDSFCNLLKEKGAHPIEFPTIAFEEIKTQNSIQILESIQDYSYLIFTSRNGVKYFFKRFLDLYTKEKVQHLKIICIGSETERYLNTFGIEARFVPEDYRGEGLVTYFDKEGNLKDKKILIPRAQEARELLEKTLDRRGALVTILPLYRATKPSNGKELQKVLLENHLDVITFASSKTCTNFFEMLGEEVRIYLNGVCFGVIGPITQKTLEKYGYKKVIIPQKYTMSSLVEAMCDYYNQEGKL